MLRTLLLMVLSLGLLTACGGGVRKLSDERDALKTQVAGLESQITGLEGQLTELQSDLDSFVAERESLIERSSQLELSLAELASERDALAEGSGQQDVELSSLNAEKADLLERLTALEASVLDLETERDTLLSQVESASAVSTDIIQAQLSESEGAEPVLESELGLVELASEEVAEEASESPVSSQQGSREEALAAYADPALKAFIPPGDSVSAISRSGDGCAILSETLTGIRTITNLACSKLPEAVLASLEEGFGTELNPDREAGGNHAPEESQDEHAEAVETGLSVEEVVEEVAEIASSESPEGVAAEAAQMSETVAEEASSAENSELSTDLSTSEEVTTDTEAENSEIIEAVEASELTNLELETPLVLSLSIRSEDGICYVSSDQNREEISLPCSMLPVVLIPAQE